MPQVRRNPGPDSEILDFYARSGEEQRLVENAAGQFEQARTEELLQRFLPAPPGLILDVGGGTGRYALWLATHGYDTHLVDPVALHVEQAERRSLAAGRPTRVHPRRRQASHALARQLPLAS